MAVVEDLTEEERYLWAILQDPSGLDQAEFALMDASNEDACFRAWPFQWVWWRCQDTHQIDQCSRSCGKSLSIKVRAFAFPHLHPGEEMVITGPEGVHVDAITDLVETAFRDSRLGTEILVGGRQSFRHKPFHCNFKNGARIMGRIPQRDGRGIKGTHPIWLELDEGQDYPDPGWVELNETLKSGHAGAVWRAHGVTRGVRDYFYKYTQPDSSWTVHKYSAMWRPTWTDKEREEKIEQYGGRDDPDYRRNILGEHGDAVSPIFVLHRLMQCVDDEQGSDYNVEEYQYFDIKDSYLREYGLDIYQALDFSQPRYELYWVGMDVGYTNHPSEILVFAEENLNKREREALAKRNKASPPEGRSRLKLVTRITLTRIRTGDQYNAIKHVIRHFRPKAFAMDKTGNGLPLFQLVEDDDDKSIADYIKGYNFSGKILVDFDPTVEIDDRMDQDDIAKEAGINRNPVEYATDRLRHLVDEHRLWLPWDKGLIGEFQGQTYRITKTAMDQYGKREYSQGKFHALDAARMAVLGYAQFGIEEMMKKAKDTPVLDQFVF